MLTKKRIYATTYALKFLLLMFAGWFTLDSPALPDEGSRRQRVTTADKREGSTQGSCYSRPIR